MRNQEQIKNEFLLLRNTIRSLQNCIENEHKTMFHELNAALAKTVEDAIDSKNINELRRMVNLLDDINMAGV